MSTNTLIFFGRPGGNPNYHKNLEQGAYTYRDETCSCIYCGKAAKDFFVHLNWDNTPCEIGTPGDVLGFYPIGSDCAKLARKAGIKVYSLAEVLAF